jgi:hypothetical protein
MSKPWLGVPPNVLQLTSKYSFTSNAWSTTCQRSAINRTPVDCFGDSRTRHGCDYPGCTKTFSRPQDIGRHKLSVHKEGGFRLYCPLVGGDGCSREGGFPRKDKLKDHLLRKHKVSDQELSGLLQESSGSPERPTDTTLASEEAYAPTTSPQEIPSSSKRGVLDQVTSDHAHLGASGDDNAGSLYISPMALQLDHEGSTTGITSNIAAALSSVDLARPSGAISSRNLGSQSYEHHQYPQSTLGRVILAPQPLVHTGRGHTSSPEGPTLRDVRNTAAGSTSNLQKQPRSQTTSLRTAYPGVDLAGLACGSVRRTVGETGATASSSFSQRPQKPFGPSFSSSQWAPTNDFSTERFTFAR